MSDRLTANTSGIFNWSSSNTQIDFGNASANGEIVVSRLNILPDSLPNSNPNTDYYWIINNYGNNSTFSALDHLRLKTASGQPFGNPSDAKLWIRSDNEHLQNWTSSCGADNFDNGYYDYSNSCSINNMSQFFIQSVDSFPILGEYLVSQVNMQLCSYDSIYLEGQFQHNTGVYYDTVNVSSAVDSVYITIVSLDSITGIDTQNACDSYTWVDGNTYTQSNNSATFHTNMGEECDSVSKLNLSLASSSIYTDNITSCIPISWLDGNLYAASNNMATHVVTNAAGCDSIISINLVLNSIESSVVQNGSTLMAMQSGAAYQWLDCEDNLGQISGATAQTFTAQTNGSYAVLISIEDCADTSDCINIKNVGLKELESNNIILIYPNPNNGFFQIQSEQKIQSIRVINNLGQTVYTNKYNSYPINLVELSVSLAAGLYVVEIETPQNTELGMLIIND